MKDLQIVSAYRLKYALVTLLDVDRGDSTLSGFVLNEHNELRSKLNHIQYYLKVGKSLVKNDWAVL